MRIDILTLFPQMFAPLKESIIGRAQKENKIEINLIDFREFSTNKHKKVDDYPFGGSEGMLLTCQPIYDAFLHLDPEHKALRIYTSAKGQIFDQQTAKNLAKDYKHIIILCGHYEGVDERIISLCIDKQISIGNFVLTGGELPSMVICDAVCRLLPGVLSSVENFQNESHYNGELEEPQYTRPAEFMGLKVPEILLSGNHKAIEDWRKDNRKKI